MENQTENAAEKWVDHIIDTTGMVLGPRASYAYYNDPRRLAFMLARYKFCAKMLVGKSQVVEVGCGDCFGSPLVAQICDKMMCVDIEQKLIENNKLRMQAVAKIECEVCDILEASPQGLYDGALSLDVLEHISDEVEHKYFENICNVLTDDAIFVVGMPNITSEKYASKPGSSPHINLKDEKGIRDVMGKYFKNVLIFSMNDEVVHTGFTPMAHYLFGVGIGKM